MHRLFSAFCRCFFSRSCCSGFFSSFSCSGGGQFSLLLSDSFSFRFVHFLLCFEASGSFCLRSVRIFCLDGSQRSDLSVFPSLEFSLSRSFVERALLNTTKQVLHQANAFA